MKTILIIVALAICFLALNQNVKADTYGEAQIVGLAVSGDNIVVFASSYTNGSNCSECAYSDFWWPDGTAYVFWFPKSGNDTMYTLLLTAYAMGKKIQMGTTYSHFAFGNGTYSLMGNVNMGDY